MQIPILIEPIANGRFRARIGEPFALSVEGASTTEATHLIEEALKSRLCSGVQIAAVNISNGEVATEPVLPSDELYKTDWVYRELQEAIAENRRNEDSAEP